MKSVLRKIARLFEPISSRIFKVIYFFLDGFYPRTEYCRLCGFPINRHKHHLWTLWADAEVLNLVNKNYYVYPICKHCRKTKTWDIIYKAYEDYYRDLFSWTNKLLFTWSDIELALLRDKSINLVPGDIKFWESTIKKAYKTSNNDGIEYCGFKKGAEIKEVVIAAENLSKKYKGIRVEKTPTRISIRFSKNGEKRKKREKEESGRIIYLPGNVQS